MEGTTIDGEGGGDFRVQLNDEVCGAFPESEMLGTGLDVEVTSHGLTEVVRKFLWADIRLDTLGSFTRLVEGQGTDCGVADKKLAIAPFF